jgi:hypothetical protein
LFVTVLNRKTRKNPFFKGYVRTAKSPPKMSDFSRKLWRREGQSIVSVRVVVAVMEEVIVSVPMMLTV